MNISCDVIKDILPLYTEHMTSEDTNQLVEEHLADCPACRQRAQEMKEPEQPAHRDSENLAKLQKQLHRRRVLTAWFVFFLTASVILGSYAYWTGPVYLTAEEAAISVVQADESSFVYYVDQNGEIQSVVGILGDEAQSASKGLIVTFGSKVRNLWEDRYTDPDTGEEIVTLSAACIRWDTIFPAENGSGGYHMSGDVSKVYYAGMNGQEDVLLWGNESNGGVQTLPRLVLGYYLLISAFLGAILLLAGWMLRKTKGWKGCTAAGCYFACFALSDLLISGGKWPVFGGEDVPVLLCFMALLAALMTASIFCGMKVWMLHKEDGRLIA